MAKVTKAQVDAGLRAQVFEMLINDVEGFTRINDRQYGILLTDANGHQRYVRVGAIVAEEREDMTADELMQSEIDEYNSKQLEKEAKAQAKAEKIARDKARREAEKAKREAEKAKREAEGE